MCSHCYKVVQGAANDAITESRMIDLSCHGKHADSAESLPKLDEDGALI